MYFFLFVCDGFERLRSGSSRQIEMSPSRRAVILRRDNEKNQLAGLIGCAVGDQSPEALITPMIAEAPASMRG